VASRILGWSLAKEILLYRKRWIESRSSWRPRLKVRNGYIPVSGMATGNVADNGRTPARFIFGRLGLFGVQQAVRPVIASVATPYLPDSPLTVEWPPLDRRSFGKLPALLQRVGTWVLVWICKEHGLCIFRRLSTLQSRGQMSCQINHTKFWLKHLCCCTTSR
jgi:hypothetical protein